MPGLPDLETVCLVVFVRMQRVFVCVCGRGCT
jgi:hypothetical protein